MKILYADNSYYVINNKAVYLIHNEDYSSFKEYPYVAYPWLVDLTSQSETFVSSHEIAQCPISVSEELVESGVCLSTRCKSCIQRESYSFVLQNWLTPETECIGPIIGMRCALWSTLGDSVQAGGFSPDCVCYRNESVPALQTTNNSWLVERIKNKLMNGVEQFVPGSMWFPDKMELDKLLREEPVAFIAQINQSADTPEDICIQDLMVTHWMCISLDSINGGVSLLMNEIGYMMQQLEGRTLMYLANKDVLIASLDSYKMQTGYYLLE